MQPATARATMVTVRRAMEWERHGQDGVAYLHCQIETETNDGAPMKYMTAY
jgi:hypothetical protein